MFNSIPAVMPMQFEKIEPEEVAALNLFAQGIYMPFEFEGASYRANLSLIEARSRVGTRSSLFTSQWYEIDYKAGRFFVGLTDYDRQGLAALFNVDVTLSDLPDALKEALDHLFFTAMCNSVADSLQLKRVSWRYLNALPLEYVWFNASCESHNHDGISGGFQCLWDRSELDVFTGLTRFHSPQPVRQVLQGWDQIKVSARFILGQSLISLADCLDLALNDVLFLERPKPTAVEVKIKGRWSAPGLMLKRRIILEADMAKGQVMNETEETQLGANLAGDYPMQDIPITLEFQAGSVVLPLSELTQLTKGYVFELEAPLNRIQICANGQLIAEGEMVDISGRTGVRITDIKVQNMQLPQETQESAEPPMVVETELLEAESIQTELTTVI